MGCKVCLVSAGHHALCNRGYSMKHVSLEEVWSASPGPYAGWQELPRCPCPSFLLLRCSSGSRKTKLFLCTTSCPGFSAPNPVPAAIGRYCTKWYCYLQNTLLKLGFWGDPVHLRMKMIAYLKIHSINGKIFRHWTRLSIFWKSWLRPPLHCLPTPILRNVHSVFLGLKFMLTLLCFQLN